MKKPADTKFYKNLNKPPFQPPAWLFAPVWTIIYILLFISLVFLIKAPFHPLKPVAYILFSIQMILNVSWMPVFFKKQKICAGFCNKCFVVFLHNCNDNCLLSNIFLRVDSADTVSFLVSICICNKFVYLRNELNPVVNLCCVSICNFFFCNYLYTWHKLR